MIITYPLNGIQYDASDAETYLCTRESGVFSAENNFETTVTGAREITVSSGIAWIKNADYKGKSVYNDSDVVLNISAANGALPRIDRVVLRFDAAQNVSTIVVVDGTPSSSPVAPAVSRTALVYELGLAIVEIPAGSTEISASDVSSTILDESVCGLMRDGVTGIPTAALQRQAEALIEGLRTAISGIEAGTDVMLQSVFNPQGKVGQIALDDEKSDIGHIHGNINNDGTIGEDKDLILATGEEGKIIAMSPSDARKMFRIQSFITHSWQKQSNVSSLDMVKHNWPDISVGNGMIFVSGGEFGATESYIYSKTNNSYGAVIEFGYAYSNIVYHKLFGGVWS